MIVDFFLRIRSLIQRNNWEATKLLVSSVPKSSMIRRSQLKMLPVYLLCLVGAGKSMAGKELKQVESGEIDHAERPVQQFPGDTVGKKGLPTPVSP